MKKYRPTPVARRLRRNGHYVGWFFDETYRVNVHVLWPTSEAQLKAYIKDTFKMDYMPRDEKESPAMSTLTLYPKGRSTQYLIWIPEWNGDAADVGMLAHEALHIVEGVFSVRGIPMTPGLEEPWCYFLERVMRECFALINGR